MSVVETALLAKRYVHLSKWNLIKVHMLLPLGLHERLWRHMINHGCVWPRRNDAVYSDVHKLHITYQVLTFANR